MNIKKLKPLAVYDEGDIVEAQVKYILSEPESFDYIPKEDLNENKIREYVYNDGDLFQEEWNNFRDYLTELMNEINKGRNTYKIIGKNMGWRHLTGNKILKADDGIELLKGILPNTNEFSLYVYKTKTTLIIKCSHHDSPTGEYYYIKPLSKKELNEYQNETF